MFKDQYDTLNTSIQPSVDLVERTKRQRSFKRVYKILVSVSMICMIIGVYYLWPGVDKEIKQSIVVEEPKDKYYKDLNFASGKAITILEQGNANRLDVMAFKEEELKHSDAVVKITIQEAIIEEVNKEKFIIYKAKVDKGYSGELKKEEYIYIRDNLYYYSPCLGDSIDIYMENHQYILALCKMDSNAEYRTMYPFGAQIEVTLDNEYLFKITANKEDWWTSMVNEKAKKIIDKEWLYYRNDADFEKDFQNIVDKYCNNIE